jgi:hypothetical protein
MADENDTKEKPADGTGDAGKPDSGRDAGEKGADVRIPKERLDAEIAKTRAEREAREKAEATLAALQKEKDDAAAAAKAAADRKAIEDGKLKDVLAERDKDLAAAKTAHEQLAAEHKTQGELVARLTDHVNGQIDADVAAWPEDVKAGDPGKEHLAERMQWAERVRAARTAAGEQTPKATMSGRNGTGGKPRPEARADEVTAGVAAEAAIRQDVRRGF